MVCAQSDPVNNWIFAEIKACGCCSDTESRLRSESGTKMSDGLSAVLRLGEEFGGRAGSRHKGEDRQEEEGAERLMPACRS